MNVKCNRLGSLLDRHVWEMSGGVCPELKTKANSDLLDQAN